MIRSAKAQSPANKYPTENATDIQRGALSCHMCLLVTCVRWDIPNIHVNLLRRWPAMAAEGRRLGLAVVLSAGPGYDDSRIRPWNAHHARARDRPSDRRRSGGDREGFMLINRKPGDRGQNKVYTDGGERVGVGGGGVGWDGWWWGVRCAVRLSSGTRSGMRGPFYHYSLRLGACLNAEAAWWVTLCMALLTWCIGGGGGGRGGEGSYYAAMCAAALEAKPDAVGAQFLLYSPVFLKKVYFRRALLDYHHDSVTTATATHPLNENHYYAHHHPHH